MWKWRGSMTPMAPASSFASRSAAWLCERRGSGAPLGNVHWLPPLVWTTRTSAGESTRRQHMVAVEGILRPSLRHVAILESVRKLVSLANAHQKLGLRKQLLDLHPHLFARPGDRGEIDVCGEILLAGSLVGVGASGMTPIRHERAAVATRELFVPRVTVVNDNDNFQQSPASD